MYNYAKTAVTNATSSSSNNRGNNFFHSYYGGGGSNGSKSESYYNKQGQAVKGVYFSAPSGREFSPLAINPENKTLGFLGRVCESSKEDIPKSAINGLDATATAIENSGKVLLTSKGLPQTVDVTKEGLYYFVNGFNKNQMSGRYLVENVGKYDN